MIVNTYYMSFKNPITYCPQVKELNESSIKDLEINFNHRRRGKSKMNMRILILIMHFIFFNFVKRFKY